MKLLQLLGSVVVCCSLLALPGPHAAAQEFGAVVRERDDLDLAAAEVEALYPTFSMPVSIALFDLGVPVISNGEEEGGDENGISVPANKEGAVEKADQKA